ncbi:MFS transporter [Salipaludibacillus neizhouensis]|uniref:MFS transporter n=1 Tax=Salipaludibacillus neizhouensis TaxID=885475 RepID=A0A3A9KK33_9BACI|nr:MFS transporter [Salipaludibacillus neizhouensis]RKL68145.1 MFS transporter [Salipaludibacillus neizhouensis]
MTTSKATQTVLFSLIYYFVYTDVALSPFYPQFFEKVFGITDLEYTAFYIFIARFTVVIAVPILGILSKYFEVKHLLYIGQWISVGMLVGMAGAQNVQQFLWCTVLLLIGKSSFFLIYPLLIALNGEKKRSTVVGIYHTTFHGAIILGTLSGAWFINLEDPLLLFYGWAVVEATLWFICCISLRKLPSRKKIVAKKTSVQSGGKQFRFLVAIGLVIFAFHVANNMIRPYFTTFTITDFNLSLLESSILFLIPSLMALIAYPTIRKFCSPDKLSFVFAFALGILAISLTLQGMTNSLLVLCIGRAFYGFFLAIAQSTLELYLFQKSSNQLNVNYTIASSFQNAGLLVAPLLASTSVVTYNLAAPLVVAGAICLLTFFVACLTILKDRKTPIQKDVAKEVV